MLIGREGDRLGMEVAAREDLAGLGEDQRIVGDAVRLALEHVAAPGAAGRGRRP